MSTRVRLVLLSFLMLFVELALIRWTGSNVLYLSYFSNFVLLGSFLGIGVGFLRAEAGVDLFPYAPFTCTFFVALVIIFPVEIDRAGSDLIAFGFFTTSGLPSWIMLPACFRGCRRRYDDDIAEGVARTFAEFRALEAYRLDISGSLVGIVAFSALSFVWAPPVAWGLVVVVSVAVLLLRGCASCNGWPWPPCSSSLDASPSCPSGAGRRAPRSGSDPTRGPAVPLRYDYQRNPAPGHHFHGRAAG